MAEAANEAGRKRYAVVTGANRGIGLEICKQLASNGITVVLTARDEKRGLEALETFKGTNFSHLLLFHQLDVADANSVASLAEFIKTQFGRLDILVNNAAIVGATFKMDGEAFRATGFGDKFAAGAQIDWDELLTHTWELAVECLQTNYYGVKRMIEHFIPLLQLSADPRIVNVSSFMSKLKTFSNEWAKSILREVENLTEEKIDEVLNEFLNDFKEGLLEGKGWPASLPVYTISKAALNAYTRILAKSYPRICINCTCPGFVKTDINFKTGILTVEQGAATPVKVALLPEGGPSGLFFERHGESSFE